MYVLYCNMFCAKDTAAPYLKFCHGHCLTLFHGCCCFIYTYIACSRYVCCMLCTGMFRLLVLVLYISYTVYCCTCVMSTTTLCFEHCYFIRMLHAVYSNMFCPLGITASHCILCTAIHFCHGNCCALCMYAVLPYALCHGHCYFMYYM